MSTESESKRAKAIQLARQAAVSLEVRGQRDPVRATSNALAEKTASGFRRGDTILMEAGMIAASDWITDYSSKLWDAYLERLEAANLLLDVTSVDAAWRDLRRLLYEQVARWTQLLKQSSLVQEYVGEKHVQIYVDRAVTRSISSLESKFLKTRDAAHLSAEYSDQTPPSSSRNVAVIYGRDLAAYDCSMEAVRATGLIPYDFEQAKKSLETGHEYVHEIVGQLLQNAAVALVVFTPDERATLEIQLQSADDSPESKTRLQPRPNVLLEFGLAVGVLQRNVVLLEFGKVGMPSDIHGIHPIRWKSYVETVQDLYDKFRKIGMPVENEPRLDNPCEYEPKIPEFPYAGLDWRKLEFRHADPASIESNPTYQKYKEAGFSISNAREESVMEKERDGAIVAVFEEDGQLFTAGLERADSKTIYIARPSSNGNP